MKMPSEIVKRSIVRIIYGGTSRRAVVLERSARGVLLVIAGTRTKRPHYAHVSVEGQEATKCGFPETTHFYTDGIVERPLADCQKVDGQCLYPRFFDLRTFAAVRIRAFLSAQAASAAESIPATPDESPGDQSA